MLRQPARGLRLPLQAFNKPTQQAAWNGAWSRPFTSQVGDRMTAQVFRWRTAPLQGLMARIRERTAGVRFATAPGSLQGVLRRGFRFTARRSNRAADAAGKETEKLTMSQRLKKLTKEYGWVTLGVYLGLTVLDLPLCFLLVRSVGADKIGKIEHQVLESIKQVIPESVREKCHQIWQSIRWTETKTLGDDKITDGVEMATWDLKTAQEKNEEGASLGTQLALAYAIHKTLLPIRVPLAVTLVPRVVKVLRGWGWKVGKKAV